MDELLTTKELAKFLHINEKKVYTLIEEQGLPATKVTGKWLFPKHLVERWIENNTINYPLKRAFNIPSSLIVIAGSNDILLDKFLQIFMRKYPNYIVAFANVGSMGGIRALKMGNCHIATSHLLQEDKKEFNFDYIFQEMKQMPAVVNFCLREQGLIVAKGNPKNIKGLEDLISKDVKIVNRPKGTGTRLWFDQELKKIGIDPASIEGYNNEKKTHLEVGIEILTQKADAGPGIRAVASILGLDFIPFHWERFDFIIDRDRFFDQHIQTLLSLLHEEDFRNLLKNFEGYDLKYSGRMVYPKYYQENNINKIF